MSATIRVVGAAIIEGDKCFVAQRREGGSAGGKWEFPGGKVEAGESLEQALVREIQEELGVSVQVLALLGTGQAETSRGPIQLDVFRAKLNSSAEQIVLHDHQAMNWIRAEEVTSLDWAAADVPILPAVVDQLQSESKKERR